MKKIHRIIQEEIFRLTESMDVYIGDANELQAETINDVAWILGLDVLEKEWWNKQSTERKEQYRNDKPMSVFTPDGGTEDVINFYVRGLSPEEVSQIVESVKRVLPLYEVKLLNIDDSEATRVIRFKVQLPQTNAAPRLNISNDNAVSLMKLMGLDKDQLDYTIPEMETGLARAKYYMDEPNSGLVDKTHHTQGQGDERNQYRSNLGKDSVTRYLTEIQKIVEYAKKLGYDSITIA